MFNLVQLQEDIYNILLSSQQLANVNIVSQRKMKLRSEVDMATIWTTARNGCAGAGLLVEMPTANCDTQIAGPILDWKISVLVLEVPNLNFAQPSTNWQMKGTFLAAEDIVQMVLDELHLYADDMTATLTADRQPVAEASIPSHALGYRVGFNMPKGKNTQTPRTGQVQITNSTPGTVSLACANDPTAQIRFTTNGNFPGLDNAHSVGQVYSGPLTLPAGSSVRARAYASAKLGGATAFLNSSV